jgi:hypothetical protein
MIPIDKLRSVQKLVTHARCPDGIASAILILDAMPWLEPPDVIFLEHGSREYAELRCEPGMLFCDLAPPAARVREFVEAGAIVLDHHAGARETVQAFGELGVFADERTEPGVSGAVLAFREVWRPIAGGVYLEPARTVALVQAEAEAEDFARLAGIRDTWRRDSEDWRAACEQAAALMFYPVSTWLAMMPGFFGRSDCQDKLAIGKVLLDQRLELNRYELSKAHLHETGRGTKLVLVNTTDTSDLAELLREPTADSRQPTAPENPVPNVDILIGFRYMSEPDGTTRLRLSMRSVSHVPVLPLATHLGGSGHERAAGAVIRLRFDDPNPYAMISRMYEIFEGEADSRQPTADSQMKSERPA